MAIGFHDFLAWRWHVPRMPEVWRCPITVDPQNDPVSALVRWISCGWLTKLYVNGKLVESLTPTRGAATRSIALPLGTTASVDVMECRSSTSTPSPQPDEQVYPEFSFASVNDAKGYWVFASSVVSKMRTLCYIPPADAATVTARSQFRLPDSVCTIGTRYRFRLEAERTDPTTVTDATDEQMLPDQWIIARPAPADIQIEIEGQNVRFSTQILSVSNGMTPHKVRLTVVNTSTNSDVATFKLNASHGNETFHLPPGSYRLRVEQSGGLWTHLYDREPRFFSVPDPIT